VPEAAYVVFSLALTGCGGGLYFWTSFDEVLLTVSDIKKPWLLTIISLSNYFFLLTHGFNLEVEGTPDGFILANRMTLAIALPCAALLAIAPKDKKPPTGEPTAPTGEPISPAFAPYLLFSTAYACLQTIPPLVLFYAFLSSPEPEATFILRSVGVLVGELFFCFMPSRMAHALGLIATAVLPGLIFAWTQLEVNIVAVLVCIGVFTGIVNAWLMEILLIEWNRKATPARLSALLGMTSLATLPAAFLVPVWLAVYPLMWEMYESLLNVALLLSLACLLLAVYHVSLRLPNEELRG
jgi:hypothetical protein